MNIKTSISLFLLLMGVSFSASSAVIGGDTWLLKLNSFSGSWSSTPPPYCGLSVGDIFKGSACNGVEWEYSGSTYTVTTTQFDTGNGQLRGIDRNRGRSFVIGTASRAWSCPSGTNWSDTEKKCIEPVTCSSKKGKNAPWPSSPIPDDGQPLTQLRQFCDTNDMCEAVAGYSASGGTLQKDSFYTGNDCVGEQNDYAECPYYGGCGQPEPDLPDPWPHCEKPFEDDDFVCRQDLDGDGQPDADAPYDNDARCNYNSSNEFECTGGSFDQTDPTDPTDPVDPTDPTDPTDPVDPTDPTEPTEPTDPTDPIDPVDPSKPITPDPVDPVETTPPPQVEPVPPSQGDGSDAGTITAIRNMNADMNASLNNLNRDLNLNFNDVNNELKKLSAVADATNENVIKQLEQDLEIYERQKQLTLDQTAKLETAIESSSKDVSQAITDANTELIAKNNENHEALVEAVSSASSTLGESIGESIEASTDSIVGAVSGSTSSIVGAVSGSTSSIVGSIDKLSEKLDNIEACDPNTDPRACEGQHGLDTGLSSEIIYQFNDHVDAAISAAEAPLLNEIEKAINEPLISKDELLPFIDGVVGIIPDYSKCKPIDFFGATVPCQRFEEFKAFLGFVLFIGTLWELFEIVTSGINPKESAPYLRRK